MQFAFDSEEPALEALTGAPPTLDSCFSTLAFSKIGYPDEIKNWFKDIELVPGYALLRNHPFEAAGANGCIYRFTACHKLQPSVIKDIAKFSIHAGIVKYDFWIHMLSKKNIGQNNFYEYFVTALTFPSTDEGINPPKGGRWFSIDGQEYFQLFHHTTAEGKAGILKDRFIAASRFNFCGTRYLKKKHCYFTDMPKVVTSIDTLPLLMRQPGGPRVYFITDDLSRVADSGIKVLDRELKCHMAFLVHPEIVQPNPMVRHFNTEGQPDWIEIMFPRIYRCPCDGLVLDRSIEIEGVPHWIVNSENASGLRVNDPICCSSGNDVAALKGLIDDYYAE